VGKKKSATKKQPKKPAKKPTRKRAAAESKPIADSSPELLARGFFRAEYHWEADRDIPALETRVRVLVDHRDGRVEPAQAKAVGLLFESQADLKKLALKAAYETMLAWVEGYRTRHPDFRGKPIGEKPFMRGCELKSVLFPSAPDAKPVFVLTLFWPEDTRPCEVVFEWQKGKWVAAGCERN
jgi:hypothetical protein